jgi:hypothetical protein
MPATGAELGYNVNATAVQMANAIFGDGVQVTGATLTGPRNSSAIYTNGQLTGGVAPSDTGVILSTGNVQSFTQSSGDPNRSTSTSTDTSGVDNNSWFNQIAGTRTYDATWLDVSFIPQGDQMTIRFVFSSEEYPEYAGSQFNDVVGVWINGQHVPVSVGNGTTGVTNINQNNQPNLVTSNTGDAYNTEMDGFTVTLSLDIPVRPGQVNSIRIGIADTSDSQYDSNLLIAGDSIQTALVAADDKIGVPVNGSRVVDVLGNDRSSSGATLRITHVNGIPVSAGSTITLASGQTITLNADGTFTVIGDGDTETVNFTYTVTDGTRSDVAVVTLEQVPCFTAGTRILTIHGEVAVEDLRPGDLVQTHDEGFQPLRWVGSRTVAAEGAFAPVKIRAGTFGPHGTLRLSPQHRVLVRDALAELMFGEAEVLVAAKDLVNGRSVTQVEDGEVTYVHLLFDRHQVVYSEGLATESYLPGPMTEASFAAETLAEICALFPELDPETGTGYSPAARRTLKSWEARVLTATAAATAA